MRSIIVVAGLLVLSACSGVWPYVEADVLTTIATGKTLPDHAYSLYSGKDCSIVRMKLGRSYCVEDEPNPGATVRCYRSLGTVSCFGADDPFMSRYQNVGQGNEPNSVFN